jgi:RNA-directed DNA polymerase
MREKQSKRMTTDGEKSERSRSTYDAGEPTRGTPSREGERRATEPLEGKAPEQRAPISVATKLERIAMRAKERPHEVITTLNHFIDVEWLREAHRRTRKDGAVGVDDVTAQEYEQALDENLTSMLSRFKSKTYRAPPVRRVHIPKGDGSKTRPIGIPTFEDKVLQRSVSMALTAVYEQEFRSCSFGYRPGRSPHQALEALRATMMSMGGGVVLEVDIQGFFDNLVHDHLGEFLDLRVRDGVIRQAIGSWLKAGVLEDGLISRPDKGSPQGGVISPLLANIYLHHVLDVWFEDEIMPRLSGRASLVRYADDVVIVFSDEADARRVMEVLPKRFGKYGLTLHPEKTRLVPFHRPKGGNDDGPGAFDFLGFTHFWGKSRWKNWVVQRKTASSRMRRALAAVAAWCRAHRHDPVREQHKALSRKLVGHYQYFGITGNWSALNLVRRRVQETWRKWLDRRSQRRRMSWERFTELLARMPLPPPKVVHSAFRRTAKP